MQKLKLKRTSAALLSTAFLAFTVAAHAAPGAEAAAGQAKQTQSANAAPGAKDRAADRGKAWQKRGHKHRHHGHKHQSMKDVAMWIPGYGAVSKDVVESLSLDDKQAAKLKEAQDYNAAQFQKKGKRQGAKDAGRPEVKAGSTLDPHGAAKSRQARFDEMQKGAAEGTQKWLDVWDSLEHAQQQTLTAHVVERTEKRAQRRAERQEKREAAKTQGK